MNPLFDGGGDDTTDTGYLLVNDAADADDQVPEQAADASLDDAAALQAGAGDTPARATVEEAPMSDLKHWKVSDLGCDVVVDEFEDVGTLMFVGKNAAGKARCGVAFPSPTGEMDGTKGQVLYFKCAEKCGILAEPESVHAYTGEEDDAGHSAADTPDLANARDAPANEQGTTSKVTVKVLGADDLAELKRRADLATAKGPPVSADAGGTPEKEQGMTFRVAATVLGAANRFRQAVSKVTGHRKSDEVIVPADDGGNGGGPGRLDVSDWARRARRRSSNFTRGERQSSLKNNLKKVRCRG